MLNQTSGFQCIFLQDSNRDYLLKPHYKDLLDFPKTKNQVGGIFCICVCLCEDLWSLWFLTGAVLDGVGPSHGGGSIEGAGEAERAAVFGLVVISGTRVTGNQTGTGELPGRTGDCMSGEQSRSEEGSTKKDNSTIYQNIFFFKVTLIGWKVEA